MSAKPIKLPGPDHPIAIERNPGRVVVRADGKILADSRNALTLRESSYPPVQYIPRADVDMTHTIINTAKPLGIAVHDHIIIGKDGHASLKGLRLI